MAIRDTLSTEKNYKDGLMSNKEALQYFQEKLMWSLDIIKLESMILKN